MGRTPEIEPRDDRDLAGFGYAPSLDRTLGAFSSFAAGFAFISILTGLFQMVPLGYGAAGPRFFWTWPVVALGQMTVALCFAELATHYPLCGSVYQWAARVGSPALGWMAGWISLAGTVVSLAAVSMALQAALPAISPAFQVVGQPENPADAARNGVVLACGLILLTTFLNARGVGLLARINNVGVIAEMAGAVALIVLLFAHARRGPSVIWRGRGTGMGIGPDRCVAGLLLATLTASYVLYGFETAGSLAEETVSPRERSPRAILKALGAAAVLGGMLILAGLMAAPDLNDPALSQAGGGLTTIVRETLGPVVGRASLVVVVMAIVSCALAVHTGAVRLVFAMARDGYLPGARWLTKVGGATKTPEGPAVVVGGAAVLLLLVNLNAPKVVEVVAAVSVVWINLAYLCVTVPLLARRMQGWPEMRDGSFRLGKLGIPVNALAVAWGFAIVINTAWPRWEVYGNSPGGPWFERFAAVEGTIGLILAGLLYYHGSRKVRGRAAAGEAPR